MNTDVCPEKLSADELYLVDLARRSPPGIASAELDAGLEHLNTVKSPLGLLFQAITLDAGHTDNPEPSVRPPALIECDPTWQPVPGHPDIKCFVFCAPYGTSLLHPPFPVLGRQSTLEGDDHYTAARLRLSPELMLEFRDHEWVDNMQCQMDVQGTLFRALREEAMDKFIACRPKIADEERLYKNFLELSPQVLKAEISDVDTSRHYDGRQSFAHLAANVGNADKLNFLIQTGVDIDVRNWRGETPMHEAAVSPYPSAANVVRLLHKQRANIDAMDILGQTPLHYAVRADRQGTTDALIEGGAALDMKDYEGNTPLHMAVKYYATDMVAALLTAGADPDVRNNAGLSPEHANDIVGKPVPTDIAKLFSSWRAQQAVSSVLGKLKPTA